MFAEAHHGQRDVVVLCNADVSKNPSGEDGTTPLALAAHSGHESVVQALCEHGAETRPIKQGGVCATAAARSCGRDHVQEYLKKVISQICVVRVGFEDKLRMELKIERTTTAVELLDAMTGKKRSKYLKTPANFDEEMKKVVPTERELVLVVGTEAFEGKHAVGDLVPLGAHSEDSQDGPLRVDIMQLA